MHPSFPHAFGAAQLDDAVFVCTAVVSGRVSLPPDAVDGGVPAADTGARGAAAGDPLEALRAAKAAEGDALAAMLEAAAAAEGDSKVRI